MIRALNIFAVCWTVISIALCIWQAWHGDIARSIASLASGFCAASVLIQNRAFRATKETA